MHISLTPKLEQIVRGKIQSGLYSNASEVIRDALRQMDQHDALMKQVKLTLLRQAVADGARQAESNELTDLPSAEELIEEAEKPSNV